MLYYIITGRQARISTPALALEEASMGFAKLTALTLLAGLVMGHLTAAPAVAAPKVVASLKPLHSLVAGVMAGLGEPGLLIAGGGSPHGASLRPSQARALSKADLVFWVGAELEGALIKPIAALAGGARVVALAEAPGLTLLEAREGGRWEAHDEGPGEAADGPRDLHLWLDPDNGRRIIDVAAQALSAADPANAALYHRNAADMTTRLEALDRELAARLAAARSRPFVVFHDAYQYFERHYGLNAAGAITVNPERPPGARRLREIRAKIGELGAVCLFSEPQFEPALVDTVIQGTAARTGTLDPLGAALPAGPEAYFELLRGLAGALTTCLTPAN